MEKLVLYNVPLSPRYHTTPKSSIGFCRCSIWASTNNHFLLQPPPPPSFTTPSSPPPSFHHHRHHRFTTTTLASPPPPSPSPMATTHIRRPRPQPPRQVRTAPRHNGRRRVEAFSGATSPRATWQPNDERRRCRRSPSLFGE